MPWYALACFSSAEDKIADKIGVQAYVPKRIIWKKRRGRKREKRSYPLIPGYILVDMDLRDSVYDLVRRDHRVFGFVDACGEPLTIRETEIDYIRRKEALGHYDETKDILYKLIGGRFDIHDGALDGK
jgi:transcription antitermination factor NusG